MLNKKEVMIIRIESTHKVCSEEELNKTIDNLFKILFFLEEKLGELNIIEGEYDATGHSFKLQRK